MSGNTARHHLIVQQVQPSAGDLDGRQSQVLAQTIVKADYTQATGNGGDGYNYARLEHPVVLAPCTEYWIASYESGGQDSYPVQGTNTSSTYNASATSGLLGYNGSAPGAISGGNANFEVDTQGWTMDNAGSWAGQGTGTFVANVNIKLQ